MAIFCPCWTKQREQDSKRIDRCCMRGVERKTKVPLVVTVEPKPDFLYLFYWGPVLRKRPRTTLVVPFDHSELLTVRADTPHEHGDEMEGRISRQYVKGPGNSQRDVRQRGPKQDGGMRCVFGLGIYPINM